MHPGRAFRNEVFMDIFTGSIDERLNAVNKLLNMESNFDIIQRNLTIGNKRVVIFVINGFLNSDLCESVYHLLMQSLLTVNKVLKMRCFQGLHVL